MESVNISGIELPLLGIGTFSLDNTTLRSVLCEGYAIGYRFIDTAFRYSNESEIGKIIINNDLKFDLQSKVWGGQLCGHRRFLWLDKGRLRTAYNVSCKKLQKSSLTSYLIHGYYRGCEETYKKMMRLRDSGILKLIGVCNITIEEIDYFANCVGEYPMIVQNEIHPYMAQREMVSYCRERGIQLEARSPFAHGDVMNEWQENPILQSLANFYHKTVPQIILRWIVQQDIIAIPRTSRVDHLKENYNIFDFSLTKSQMNQIFSLNRNQSYGVISNKQLKSTISKISL